MALAELDAMIHYANTNNQKLLSIFLDLENAFPRLRQHHIFQTFHNLGVRGLLSILLQNYLQNRSVCVGVATTQSSPHDQTYRIPQDSPFSNTLFIVAKNKVCSIIPKPLHPILFVDDLSIHIYSSNIVRAHKLLQTTISAILTWLSKHGFRTSPSKTNIVMFEKRKSNTTLPSSNFKPHTHPINKFNQIPRPSISLEPLLDSPH